jgi:hypothetical protein
VAPRDRLVPMPREGLSIIRNGAGAVNSTIESVEMTQRHALLATARFGAPVGTRGLARQALTEPKEPEASTSEGPKTGKGSAVILGASRRPAVACAVRCWPLNHRWSSVLERNALRPFLAGSVSSQRPTADLRAVHPAHQRPLAALSAKWWSRPSAVLADALEVQVAEAPRTAGFWRAIRTRR